MPYRKVLCRAVLADVVIRPPALASTVLQIASLDELRPALRSDAESFSHNSANET